VGGPTLNEARRPGACSVAGPPLGTVSHDPPSSALSPSPCVTASRPSSTYGGVLGAQPHGQLALEDVEDLVVAKVDVQVRAFAARGEPRPRRVQRVGLADDLDAVRPSRR
jgi:hypothetical protein